MRKRIALLVLALISLLAVSITAFMAFTSGPNGGINPLQGLPRTSLNFDIAAASSRLWTWILEGLTAYNWKTVETWLKDTGDSIRLTWPEASFSMLNHAHLLLTWPESILGVENEGLIILLSWTVLSTAAVFIWQLGEAWRRHRAGTSKRRMRIKATETKTPLRN